jgi:hypothetical protein
MTKLPWCPLAPFSYVFSLWLMFSRKRSKSELRQSIALKDFYKKRENAKQPNKHSMKRGRLQTKTDFEEKLLK